MKHTITIFYNGKRQNEIILNDLPNFNKGVLSFGRGSQNDIPLPYQTVSRKHGELLIRGKEVRALDSGGLNKLTVNGFEVSEMLLTSGTELVVGPRHDAPGAVVLLYEAIADVEYIKRIKTPKDYGTVAVMEQEKVETEVESDSRALKAKILDRSIAGAIDYIIWFMLWIAVLIATVVIRQHLGFSLGIAIAMAQALVVGWLYFAGMEASQKRGTLGKIIMGIMVVDKYGQKITFILASKRFFIKFFSMVILGIGLLPIFGKKSLHDKICETKVIKPISNLE